MFEMTPSVIDARSCVPFEAQKLEHFSHEYIVNSSTVVTGVSYTICFKFPYKKFLVPSSRTISVDRTKSMYRVIHERGKFLFCRNQQYQWQ
jgi:hypothetical protein